MKVPRPPFIPARDDQVPVALQPDPPQRPQEKTPLRRWAPVIVSAVTFFLGVAIGSAPSSANDSAAALVSVPSPAPTVTVTAQPSATPTVTATVTATPEPAPTVTVTEAAPAEPEAQQDVQQGVVEEPAAPEEVEPAPQTAYYQNCAAARNAGAAPLYVGDPGYRSGLDRDGDGVACE